MATIVVPRDRTSIYTFRIKTADGRAFPLNGQIVAFRAWTPGGALVMAKLSDDGNGSSTGVAITDFSSGLGTVTFVPADTAELTDPVLDWEITLTDADQNVFQAEVGSLFITQVPIGSSPRPLLSMEDFPEGLVTRDVLVNLGGNAAIAAAARKEQDDIFIVIGGKYRKSDDAVTKSPAYRGILVDRTLVRLYINDQVLFTENKDLVEFLTNKTDGLLKASLKEGGAIEGLDLLTSTQAEQLGTSSFALVSNRRIFGVDDEDDCRRGSPRRDLW
jgi:hypothetical protein